MNTCPHCNSSSEEHEYLESEFDRETNTVRQIVECCECGTQWNEVYSTVYTGIDDVNVPLGPFDLDEDND
jgi:uncharacterized Zn finger protein